MGRVESGVGTSRVDDETTKRGNTREKWEWIDDRMGSKCRYNTKRIHTQVTVQWCVCRPRRALCSKMLRGQKVCSQSVDQVGQPARKPDSQTHEQVQESAGQVQGGHNRLVFTCHLWFVYGMVWHGTRTVQYAIGMHSNGWDLKKKNPHTASDRPDRGPKRAERGNHRLVQLAGWLTRATVGRRSSVEHRPATVQTYCVHGTVFFFLNSHVTR